MKRLLNWVLIKLGLRKKPWPKYIKYIDPDGNWCDIEFESAGWQWYGGKGREV